MSSVNLYHTLLALFGKWHLLPLPCICLCVCSVSTRMSFFLYLNVYFIISQVMVQSLEEIQEYSDGITYLVIVLLFFSLLLSTYFNRYFDRE